ncbi:hypothetical protein ACWGCC_00090 [Streptomyces nigrescens]
MQNTCPFLIDPIALACTEWLMRIAVLVFAFQQPAKRAGAGAGAVLS